MGKPFFEFKKFTIYHDRCAMKVGTDGVLLGAWAQVGEAKRILDIGTGSGIVAIMMAQRTQAHIIGVDIDADAVAQAAENALRSPWAEKIRIIQTDVNEYNPDFFFDAIVCNPPFFKNALQCPDLRRTNARHTCALSFLELIESVKRLLVDGGNFHVILPSESADEFVMNSWRNDLMLQKQCKVYTQTGKKPKRVLLCFKKGNCTYSPAQESLYIKNQKNEFTDSYQLLTQDFYL